jgi:uncharacterized protein
MVDWAIVSGFEWDAGNERKSADKHGVSQGEAEQVFFNQPLLVLEDDSHSLASRASMRSAGPTAEGSCTSRSRCAGATR